jgi:hypothetical protein
LNGPSLEPGPERNAAGTLRHELAHLALHATAAEGAAPIPRWFDEGIASWFAGGFAEFGPLDLAAAMTGRELTLAGLSDAFPEDPDGLRIAYAKSQLAVELLEREVGQGTIAGLGAALARGIPFPEALSAVAGMSEELGEAPAARRQPLPGGAALRRRRFSSRRLTIVGFTFRRIGSGGECSSGTARRTDTRGGGGGHRAPPTSPATVNRRGLQGLSARIRRPDRCRDRLPRRAARR